MLQVFAPKVNLCGYNVLALEQTDFKQLITDNIDNNIGGRIVTLNLEHISRSQIDDDFRDLTVSADYICADGMPIVWAGNLLSESSQKIGRCTGVDLVKDIITDQNNTAHYAILGGVDPLQALEKLEANPDRLKYLNNGIITLDDACLSELISELKQAKPDLVFVALGVKKADIIAKKISEAMPTCMVICVGGTFELLAGIKKRAPRWMQKSGLEWLHRLCLEPKRLSARYLLLYPRGLFALLKFVCKIKFRKPFRDLQYQK